MPAVTGGDHMPAVTGGDHMPAVTGGGDGRHHVNSLLMRESLLDKAIMSATESETPVIRMLPTSHVVKVGASSIVDKGRSATYPLIEAIGRALSTRKLILSTGGGLRTRHVF